MAKYPHETHTQPEPTHNLPLFQQMLHEFATWIRKPNLKKTPQNIELRRMNIYRTLFFNNVSGFLDNAFPVTREVLGQEVWATLSESFFANHLCHTPYFKEIPEEFLAWLQEIDPTAQASLTKPLTLPLPDWAPELLHYEWLELYISAKDDQWPTQQEAPTATKPVVFSPFFEMAAYRYPVQTISLNNTPTEAPATPTFLAVYRLPTHQVRFMALTPQTALFIDFLRTDPTLTPLQAAQKVTEATGQPFPQETVEQTLADLHNRTLVFSSSV